MIIPNLINSSRDYRYSQKYTKTTNLLFYYRLTEPGETVLLLFFYNNNHGLNRGKTTLKI